MPTDGNLPMPADIATSIQAIRNDREHGASWLARAAARTLQRLAEPRDDVASDVWESVMRTAARAIVAARPSMAAVANTAANVWSAGQHGSPLERRQAMRKAAARLATEDERTLQSLVADAEKYVTGTVYTISRSGTVESVLRALGHRQVIRRVIVAESHPGGEGVALGRALAESGMAVTIVADAACGVFIGEADCVVLGADSLRADGSVVNKVGSYPLALIAGEAGKPVYVICETLKIAAPNFPLTLEEMDPAELLPKTDTVAGLDARNPYFDETPAHLIASYITEEGILDREAIARDAQEAGLALARLQAE